MKIYLTAKNKGVLKITEAEWANIGKQKHWEDRSSTEKHDIFEAGKLAGKSGKARTYNPYRPETKEFDIWNYGYSIGSNPPML